MDVFIAIVIDKSYAIYNKKILNLTCIAYLLYKFKPKNILQYEEHGHSNSIKHDSPSFVHATGQELDFLALLFLKIIQISDQF